MVWRYIERISALLEPDERQQVLGDIQERGAEFTTLLDLAGLVCLRQLQAWQVWFPWMMAMLFPAFSVVYGTLAVGESAWNAPKLDTSAAMVAACVAFGAPILAYAAGFSLGFIGKRRAVIVLPCLALLFSVVAQGEARKVTQHGTYGVVTVLILMTLLAIIPSIAGFARGLQGRPLPRTTAIGLAFLFVLCAAVVVPEATGLVPSNVLIVAPLTLWPTVYAFSRSAPAREVPDAL